MWFKDQLTKYVAKQIKLFSLFVVHKFILNKKKVNEKHNKNSFRVLKIIIPREYHNNKNINCTKKITA